MVYTCGVPLRYTMSMSSDVSFSLDTEAAGSILTSMVAPLIQQSGEAIAARARSIASSISTDPPTITVTHSVGVVKKGQRAIATITASGRDAHQNYVGYVALAKAKDAGRVN